MKFLKSNSYKTFQVINYILLTLFSFTMIYPIIYCISVSISDPYAIQLGRVIFWPVGFDLQAYKIILKSPEIQNGYLNTVLYTVVGTVICLFVTILGAYPLSRKRFRARKFFAIYFIITMYFSGGMIPSYLLIARLGMMDKIWAIVFPTAFNFFFIIIMRSNFSSIPDSLAESVYMDGGGEFSVLLYIVLPLSKAIIATVILFTAVARWNDFMGPLLYLNSPKNFPITLILRRYLIDELNSTEITVFMLDSKGKKVGTGILNAIRMAIITITILPIMMIYPFIQKYFLKGMLVGSVKE